VIVGNTTKKRPDTIPKGYTLPEKEARVLTEVGGYSGPQMFERTLNLVKRYRSKLDQGPPEEPEESSPPKKQQQKQPQAESKSAQPSTSSKLDEIDASAQRDAKRLKPDTPEAEQESKQPLIQIPDRHTSTSTAEKAAALPESSSAKVPTSGTSPSTPPKLQEGEKGSEREVVEANLKKITQTGGASESSSSSSSVDKPTPAEKTPKSKKPAKKEDLTPKVIFATGGITNGEQCLEILNAGASVCQVYTAMMYGGVGTITRIKSEMRSAMSGPEEKN
jgi:dihydroorotate dehydrogenase